MTYSKNVIKSCSLHEVIDVLVSAIEAKDYYTRGHSDRVADLSTTIARSLLLSQYQVETIHMAAHLHDIGKINIPDAVLNKTERLTEEDWNHIKVHPLIGSDILKKISHFDEIAYMVLCHHERWDGNGYPQGISSTNIPLGSRIIAIADSIDAMLSDRPYRNALSHDECIRELHKGTGIQFDPYLIKFAIKALTSYSQDHILLDTNTAY
jgi:HD-GYP domain-containing protein (c-di-GMP phosphodiesterase class II)